MENQVKTPYDTWLEEVNKVVGALDDMVEQSKDMTMPIASLLDLQTQICAIRYTIGSYLSKAEDMMITAKQKLEVHVMKQSLTLKAKGHDGNGLKYTDEVVKNTVWTAEETEALRQRMIRREVVASSLKNRMNNSKDVVIAIQARLKDAMDERISGRINSSHP